MVFIPHNWFWSKSLELLFLTVLFNGKYFCSEADFGSITNFSNECVHFRASRNYSKLILINISVQFGVWKSQLCSCCLLVLLISTWCKKGCRDESCPNLLFSTFVAADTDIIPSQHGHWDVNLCLLQFVHCNFSMLFTWLHLFSLQSFINPATLQQRLLGVMQYEVGSSQQMQQEVQRKFHGKLGFWHYHIFLLGEKSYEEKKSLLPWWKIVCFFQKLIENR